MTCPILELKDLNKAYDALQVTRNLSLKVLPGEIHAVIGPNGAGKTTLIGQISGATPSDSGQVLFGGTNVTGWSVAERAKAGLGRTFQITAILPEFTVLENVALGVQAHEGHSFRFFRNAARDQDLNEKAASILTEVGLADRASLRAGNLSHGEKRMLELALALAGEPKLLVLDEPMAGTGPEETARLIEILLAVKQRCPMLLVEHDMYAVFKLADRISVLVYGEIIASGAPGEIRADPKVREAYLGEEEPA
ncbi:ABC transporter ATP-binding protein [Roseibium polysiphoniae]|uniref:ABC transporter ATP-binding protein n=1 Tax=Roseibium polysiphoniae TaxID=2571221 RepID=A0A944C7L9_9HYPH|nr:ABC transporter ATP-binding protein [Roseibium polysiphoniae]MBS8258823.1 ABC transporter ATP-binding protein [Roseibium polysiphoniae]